MLLLGIGFLWKDGDEHGWQRWEKSLLTLAWIAPLFARALASATLIPLGLTSAVLVLWIALGRGVTASPSRR